VRAWLITAGTVILLAVAALWIFGAGPFGDEAPSGAPDATAIFTFGQGGGPPREFLYLDGARVDSYLSQFERGLATIEKTSASKVDKRSAEVSASPSKVGREVQAQDVFERSVTPTTTSRMVNLLGYLAQAKDLRRLPALAASERSDSAPRAAARFLAAWRDVRQGDFVQITAPVRIPRAERLYQVVRQVPETSSAGILGRRLRQAIGDDPRFPISITADDGRRVPTRLILPLQFSLLATESSLIVGRLTIIGKVLYRVPPGGRPFRDLQTWSRFRAATIRSITPDRLLARLRLTRRAVRQELLAYRTVDGPAALILPIAIYK
jgi:hypothetical protein